MVGGRARSNGIKCVHRQSAFLLLEVALCAKPYAQPTSVGQWVVANSHKGCLLSFLQAVGLLTLGHLANEGSRIILEGSESTLLRLVLVFEYYTKVTQQNVFRAKDCKNRGYQSAPKSTSPKRVKVALCVYRQQTNNKELDLMSKPNAKEIQVKDLKAITSPL
jgi:hypothetical protein